MTKITIETATLSDAVSKAARVAPTKGAAFDKAQGVLFEIDPNLRKSHILVKATNLEVSYLQKVPVLLIEGDPDRWRVPASLIANICANLPLGIGSDVTIERTGPFEITLKCGRKRVQVRCLDPDFFPLIPPFNPAGMGDVENFPLRLSQAAWATDPESDILSGVHIDGESMTACDRTRLVVVPCVVPVDAPITVPLRAIAPVIRNAGTCKVRVEKDKFHLMPDVDTQIVSTVLAASYPQVKGIMRDKFDGTIEVDPVLFNDSLNRMLVIAKSERYPRVHVTLKEKAIHLLISERDTGEMEDEIDCTGGPTDEFKIEFTPNTLTDALTAGTKELMKIDFGGTVANPSYKPNMLPIHVYDDGGFDSWLMPLAPS